LGFQQTTLFHDQGFEKEQQAEVPHNCFHFLFGLLSEVLGIHFAGIVWIEFIAGGY
jgi:hypothetical protein